MAHDSSDPLSLAPLFDDGGEPWLPVLKPVIEGQKEAPRFIGAGRDPQVVPVRELTFQALKPHPPQKWNVVIFGQNPYPRVASATGIAMFDNTFGAWGDPMFGKVTSIRCIIKAASMWKHGIDKATSTADIRKLLAQNDVVQPPEWFQAMLTQGVLLLNAALTASSDDSISTARHTSFWKPVVTAIVDEILRTKAQHGGGVVFAWWGSHAKALRAIVEKLEAKHPGVAVRHVDHCNPAAMGDAFCNGAHFADVNAALASLSLPVIDWLPSLGWNQPTKAAAVDDHGGGESKADDEAVRMGSFIQKTMDLHKLYLDRLQDVGGENTEELAAITGVFSLPAPTIADAMAALRDVMPAASFYLQQARLFVQKAARAPLSDDEAAAVFLYTTESPLYKTLNAALRHPDRSRVTPWLGYLRLFLAGLQKLEARAERVWRGVALDLRAQYPVGRVVTWWGVSSCTTQLGVARGFLGKKGKRMLFEVAPKSAVSIRALSAFTGEEELVLPPGTRLRVAAVTHEPDGLCVVRLEEVDEQRLVA